MKRALLFLCATILLTSLWGCTHQEFSFSYDAVVKENPYFVHALGGDNGYAYLNSMDVMEKKYADGFRLFEGDATLTSDNKLVMTHRWNKKNIETYLGLVYDKNDPVPTYAEFMEWKLQGSYKATSFSEVLDFMREHKDIVLMLDSGLTESEDAKNFYEAVLQEAGEDRQVLDRVMLSASNEKVLETGLEVYDFNLRNFYINKEENRSEGLKTTEEIIAYCKKMGCQSCSVSTAVVTEEMCKAFEEAGLYLFVFTTNDQEEADRLLGFGATSIGTDFLG